MGIEHHSEGVEGVDRRVILKIPGGSPPDLDDVLVQVKQKDDELIQEVEEDEGHNSGKLKRCGGIPSDRCICVYRVRYVIRACQPHLQ